MRFALCAWLSRPGPAAEENPADRVSIRVFCFLSIIPGRGIPPGAARARVRGGKNIVIEYRYAEGKHDRLPTLAGELVRLNVDVIIAGGNTVIPPVKGAAKTIPIVITEG